MARTNNPHLATLKSWETRRRNAAAKAAAKAAGVQQESGDYRYGRVERELATSGVKEIEVLHGGVADTWKVELESGSEALFKLGGHPGAYRQGIDGMSAEREKAAWEVAKVVGLDDMVAPVEIRTVDLPRRPRGFERDSHGDWVRRPAKIEKDRRGSIALWLEGTPASYLNGPDKYDVSPIDLQRAAMFDYIIGNQDRHGGNWLIDNGKLKLIDHNLSFGTVPVAQGGGNRFILNRCSQYERSQARSSPGRWPRTPERWPRMGDPADFAKPYVENKTKIVSALKELGFSTRAINNVTRRIDNAAGAGLWEDLMKSGG